MVKASHPYGAISEAGFQIIYRDSWLSDEATTKGCNPPVKDLFCPDQYVTHAQMAAFLHRALS